MKPVPFLSSWRKRERKASEPGPIHRAASTSDHPRGTRESRSASFSFRRGLKVPSITYSVSEGDTERFHGLVEARPDFFGICAPSHVPPPSPSTHSEFAPLRPPRPNRPSNLYSPSYVDFPIAEQLDKGENLPSLPLKPQKRLPELDGIWQGFLSDVNEDADSLLRDSHLDLITSHIQVTPLNRSCFNTSTVTLSMPDVTAQHPSPSTNLQRTCRASKSTSNLRGRSDSRGGHNHRPSEPLPDLAAALAMFPKPPPFGGRKIVPQPLQLNLHGNTSSVDRQSSPASSSCDSTPLPTPTLPNSHRRLTETASRYNFHSTLDARGKGDTRAGDEMDAREAHASYQNLDDDDLAPEETNGAINWGYAV